MLNTHTAEQVAAELNRRGLTTALCRPFQAHSIRHVRLTRQMSRSISTADHSDDLFLALTQAQAELGVSRASLHRWLTNGFIAGCQDQHNRWQVKIDDRPQSQNLQRATPPRWAGIPQAARAMGISDQTIRDRMASGELEVVQLRRGRQLAQAVRLRSGAFGLFDRTQ
jgi:hypothetical protein